MNIPSEFNLPDPEFPDPVAFGNQLLQASGNVEMRVSSEFVELMAKEVLAMAVNVWRLKNRLTEPLSGEPRESMNRDDIRKILRNVDSLYDSFSRLDLEIIDRTGESFDYGLPEKVVSTRPQEGLTKERVIETLRPTLKWGSQFIPGEVEIATPAKSSDLPQP